MTLADIAAMTDEVLTPAQVAPVLKSAPYAISIMAKTQQGRDALGFPVIRIKRRTKIPRIPFSKYMGWKEDECP